VAQLYPWALGSLSVTSYDLQGYRGGIISRLHTGIGSFGSMSFNFSMQFKVFSFMMCKHQTFIYTEGCKNRYTAIKVIQNSLLFVMYFISFIGLQSLFMIFFSSDNHGWQFNQCLMEVGNQTILYTYFCPLPIYIYASYRTFLFYLHYKKFAMLFTCTKT
jgi:cellulose synthase/poly-beta-1,6-N-acetylglucosamine synthase-like glycosyltransferase